MPGLTLLTGAAATLLRIFVAGFLRIRPFAMKLFRSLTPLTTETDSSSSTEGVVRFWLISQLSQKTGPKVANRF